MTECKKVNIPEVDNSEIECEEYVDGDCIYLKNINEDISDYYNLEEVEKLSVVLEVMMTQIKVLVDRINTLEGQ